MATTCQLCGGFVDIYGDHYLCCPRGGFYNRHQTVVGHLSHVAKAAGLRVLFEESVPEGTRPADMLISSWPTPGTSLAIDISVIHPIGLSHQPHLVARSDAYLEQAERVKNNAYASACGRVGWHFAPVIFSTFGKVGPKGRETISKIFNFYTSALATEKEREKALWQLHQQQQVAMKKAVARMLQFGVGLLNTSPRHAPTQHHYHQYYYQLFTHKVIWSLILQLC